MNIDSDIEEMTNLSVRVPTIQENIQAFLWAVPEKYPNQTIPIRRMVFEECLLNSERGLLDFLCKNKIGFLDEVNSNVLWMWRQQLNDSLHKISLVCEYAIAAKEFLKHFKHLLNPELLLDLDIVPRPEQKGEKEEEDIERNPLYVYPENLL